MQNNKKSNMDNNTKMAAAVFAIIISLAMYQLMSLLEVAGGICHDGSNALCICYATQLK